MDGGRSPKAGRREQQRGEEKDGNREICREGPRCGWKAVSRGALINHRWRTAATVGAEGRDAASGAAARSSLLDAVQSFADAFIERKTQCEQMWEIGWSSAKAWRGVGLVRRRGAVCNVRGDTRGVCPNTSVEQLKQQSRRTPGRRSMGRSPTVPSLQRSHPSFKTPRLCNQYKHWPHTHQDSSITLVLKRFPSPAP